VGSQQAGSQQVGSQQLGRQQWRLNKPAFASWLPAKNRPTTAISGNRNFAFIGEISCMQQ